MMRFSLIFLFMTTTVLAQPVAKPYDLQGHRGCRGLMPENTIPAFLKALEIGVNTLELDVVISADKQVVVSHEPYFNADITTDPDGKPIEKADQKNLNLYKMTYAEIKRYDTGSRGNPNFPEQQKLKTHKPLLSEVITQAEAYRKAHNLPAFSYNIELKSEASEYNVSQPEPAPFSDLVYAVITQSLTPDRVTPDRVVIQSFDFAILKQWHTQIEAGRYKKVRLAALVENLRSPDKNLEELGFTPDIYSPNYRLIGKDRISSLHQKGIKVIPWTVNNPDDMRRLLAEGVDGLITDYPNRAKAL